MSEQPEHFNGCEDVKCKERSALLALGFLDLKFLLAQLQSLLVWVVAGLRWMRIVECHYTNLLGLFLRHR